MGGQRTPAQAKPNGNVLNDCLGAATPGRLPGRAECLEQLLLAFRDIADRDDIHQAAARLGLVQQWIRAEGDRAAADPIFAELQPV
jgi:hypothetical protein